ncbi:tRNA-dependent cyclodipeptide synthase [Candidatus Pacearchaeota archaeon]|nr:tRNA-dependent cyclodipeptide synthase [Candidatus Pacearchaeota archaeon]
MKIKVIRGSTEKEVKSKKFNIYVGISLGNKWFTKDNIREYLQWALKHTKNKVGLLVADTLHAINYEVRNDMKKETSIKKSLRVGDKIIKMLNELIKELPKEVRKKVEIIRWEEVKKDIFNKKFIPVLYKEFEQNKEFKTSVINLVKDNLQNSKDKFDDEKIEKLAEYILEELPELLHGFTFKEIYYNCYLYPYDSSLTIFVEKIQNKELFSELHKKLDIKQNVFVALK